MGTVKLLNIKQIQFATLINRPYDPTLQSLVKTAGWYKTDIKLSEFLGEKIPMVYGSGGKYGGNSQLGIDPGVELRVKFHPKDEVISISGYVCHRDTHGR
mgnify:CR=1 FL=1